METIQNQEKTLEIETELNHFLDDLKEQENKEHKEHDEIKAKKELSKKNASFFDNRGFNMIPLHGKVPCMEWGKFRDKRFEDFQIYLKNDYSKYSIMTGNYSWNPNHQGIIIIDGDTPEACQWIEKNIPYTFKSPSKKEGRFHYYFLAPNGVTVESIGPTSICSDDGVERYIEVFGERDQCTLYADFEWSDEKFNSLTYFPTGMFKPLPKKDTELDDADEGAYLALMPSNSPSEALRLGYASEWIQSQTGCVSGEGKARRKASAIAFTLLHEFYLSVKEAYPLYLKWGQKKDQLDENGKWYRWTEKECKEYLIYAYKKIPDPEKWQDLLKKFDSERINSKDVGEHVKDFQQQVATTLQAAPAIEAKADEIVSEVAGDSGTSDSGLAKEALKHDAEIHGGDVPKDEIKKQQDQTDEEILNELERDVGCFFDQKKEINKQALLYPIEWIWEGYLIKRGLHMIAGKSFSGKSVFLAKILPLIANGGELNGVKIRKTPVLILDMENKVAMNAERFKCGEEDNIFWLRKKFLKKYLPLDVKRIQRIVNGFYKKTGFKDCLVVVDTLRGVAEIDIQDEESIKNFNYPLLDLCEEINFSTLLVNHQPKNGGGGYSGNSAILAAPDVLWTYDRDEDSVIAEFKVAKSRMDAGPKLSFKKVENDLILVDSKNKEMSLAGIIQQYLCGRDGVNQKELIEQMGKSEYSRGSVISTLKELVENDLINKKKGLKNTVLYFLNGAKND